MYGENGARTIRTNCAIKIVLHGLDEITGEEVSRALGETTVQHEVQNRTPKGWNTNTYTYTEHHDQRRLLTSDEVRRIGIDEAIIIVSNFKPIRARHHHWTEPPLGARPNCSAPSWAWTRPRPIHATHSEHCSRLSMVAGSGLAAEEMLRKLVARFAEVLGDVIEDAAQRADAQRVVLGDGDVVLVTANRRGEPHVAACLPRLFVAVLAQEGRELRAR